MNSKIFARFCFSRYFTDTKFCKSKTLTNMQTAHEYIHADLSASTVCELMENSQTVGTDQPIHL